MYFEKKLKKMMKNEISLDISGDISYQTGGTRFGGVPDVPKDFVWPVFETATFYDDEIKNRPLHFLAQFNCAELAEYDKDNLLPKTGLLSFFYITTAECWGFDPKDKGCAKVYWFEDVSSLSAAELPADLPKEYCFPQVGIKLNAKNSFPDWGDFELKESELVDEYDQFYEEKAMMGYDLPEISSKLLGWPDIIQNNMTTECELVSKGYDLGGLWEDVPIEERESAKKNSLDQWLLLFQLDTITHKEFELMFGDCGRIYFYIRKEDLHARRFDRVWLILQCY